MLLLARSMDRAAMTFCVCLQSGDHNDSEYRELQVVMSA